jgi:hypothetical protein
MIPIFKNDSLLNNKMPSPTNNNTIINMNDLLFKKIEDNALKELQENLFSDNIEVECNTFTDWE